VRHVANSNIRTKAADKTLELSQIKLKTLKFTKNHEFHENQRFSRKEVNFTKNVTAVKSWIKLVPSCGPLQMHKKCKKRQDRHKTAKILKIINSKHIYQSLLSRIKSWWVDMESNATPRPWTSRALCYINSHINWHWLRINVTGQYHSSNSKSSHSENK